MTSYPMQVSVTYTGAGSVTTNTPHSRQNISFESGQTLRLWVVEPIEVQSYRKNKDTPVVYYVDADEKTAVLLNSTLGRVTLDPMRNEVHRCLIKHHMLLGDYKKKAVTPRDILDFIDGGSFTMQEIPASLAKDLLGIFKRKVEESGNSLDAIRKQETSGAYRTLTLLEDASKSRGARIIESIVTDKKKKKRGEY